MSSLFRALEDGEGPRAKQSKLDKGVFSTYPQFNSQLVFPLFQIHWYSYMNVTYICNLELLTRYFVYFHIFF